MTGQQLDPRLAEFVGAVTDLVERSLDERSTTTQVARLLTDTLAAGIDLPAAVTRPDAERYVMYPLHVDARRRFSVASAVWDVGQATPVHGHETWGVVGIHTGIEHEVRYVKPRLPGVPLRRAGQHSWHAGQVTICCTTDDDVHQVSCEGDEPVVGIHVYGADIGTLERRRYDPGTGEVEWFVSTWAATGT